MFKLIQKSSYKFHITDSEGSIIGSVTVASESQAKDLIRKFGGVENRFNTVQAGAKIGKDPMVAALMANRSPIKRAAILRGC